MANYKSHIKKMKQNLYRMKAEKNKGQLKRMMKKINDKKLQTLYLQYIHESVKKGNLVNQMRKLDSLKLLPLSLKFYKDRPKWLIREADVALEMNQQMSSNGETKSISKKLKEIVTNSINDVQNSMSPDQIDKQRH